MACVTLKRPLEWIDPSMSPESGSSSPTHMIISNSPPHHGLRSPKRLRLQSFSQSSSSQYCSTPPSTCHFSSFIHNSSPSSINNGSNNYIKPISSSEIADQIREEMIRLRFIRRSNNLKAKSNEGIPTNNHNQAGNKSPMESSLGSLPSLSPQRQDGGAGALVLNPANNVDGDSRNSSSKRSSVSSSHAFNLYNNCLIGGINEENDENYQKNQNMSSNKKSQVSASNNKLSSNRMIITNNDKPLFTFNQVVMIVERLLRDKEESIRHEFENILTTRLAEQYDQFVKFSYDQIQRRFDSQALPSYLS